MLTLNIWDPSICLEWDRQPLEGFESYPVADICERYDLVVLDHPHLGEAIAAQCLWQLDDIFSEIEIATWQAQSVGPSFAFYVVDGIVWALPLDAATQVMACREDLLTEERPTNWTDLLAFQRRNRSVVQCLAGPHAYLSFLSIAGGIDQSADFRDASDISVNSTLGEEAFELMKELHALGRPGHETLNPIAILEQMHYADEISICPIIYGYVNYSRLKDRPVTFYDVPLLSDGVKPRSVLGGTGIALSKRSQPQQALIDHLGWLMSAQTQAGFIPRNSGQPSNKAAWLDKANNDRARNFYRNTLTTIENSVVRPRYDGFIAHQTAASAAIREAILHKESYVKLAADLQSLAAPRSQ